MGKGVHPLGCQAELGLHGLQQKLSFRALPAFSEHPFSWTDFGVRVATPGLVLAQIQTSSFILTLAACPEVARPTGGHGQPCHPLLASSPASFLLSGLRLIPAVKNKQL